MACATCLVFPRVDADAGAEARIGAGKLGEYKRPMTDFLADDEFVRCEVHAFAQTGGEEAVGDRQQSQVLAECDVLHMQKNDGLVGEGAVLVVDAGDDVGGLADFLVLFGGGERNLDENDFAGPLGILVEEASKASSFCLTPLIQSSLSLPTMMRLPAYLSRS